MWSLKYYLRVILRMCMEILMLWSVIFLVLICFEVFMGICILCWILFNLMLVLVLKCWIFWKRSGMGYLWSVWMCDFGCFKLVFLVYFSVLVIFCWYYLILRNIIIWLNRFMIVICVCYMLCVLKFFYFIN